MDRIFKTELEDDLTFDQKECYFILPEEKIKKVYNFYGLFKKNEEFSPEEYDEEDESTYEYVEIGEEWLVAPAFDVFEKTEEGFEKIEIKDLFHEQEVEKYWDGHNWRQKILTSENGWCEFEEVTEEFPIGYFDQLICLLSREAGMGFKYEYYVDGKTRYWKKNISYWQGTWRDSFEELEEEEFLGETLLYWSPDKEEKQYFPLIKNMAQPTCIFHEYPDFEIVEISAKQYISGSPSNEVSGEDIYKLPNEKLIKLVWSRWQGSTDKWFFCD